MTIILVIFVTALVIYYIQLLYEIHYIKTRREFLIVMIPFFKWVIDFKKFWDTLD